ncbi:MAG: glycosyltransferase [Pseudomonadota bacterium]
MLINHVLATEQKSRIFDDLIESYSKYSSYEHVASIDPIDDADVCIHHRINKSKKIPRNSLAFIHHDLMDIDPAFSLKQYLLPIRKTSGIICLNTLQRKILLEEGLKSQIEVIPHGYACTTEAIEIFKGIKLRKSRQQNFNETKKTVLFINSRRYMRGVKGESNIRMLVKDLDINSYEFRLCGKDRLIDAIHARNNGFTAIHNQPKSYLESLELYNHADLLLILSWYEGGPASLPEAISTETPVITRRIAMAHDLFEENYLGFFSNYEELQTLLTNWRSSKEFREELNAQTQNAVKNVLSQAAVSNAIDKFCERILK